MFENVFETVNSGFAQVLYEDYLRDPTSVPPQWRALFEDGLEGEEPVPTGRGEDEKTESDPAPAPAGATVTPEGPELIRGPALRLLQNMEASLELPTATSFREIDVSKLWGVRAAINKALKPN